MKEPKSSSMFIRMTEWDRELIERNAKACDKIPSAYVREIATNMCILKYDYDSVLNHNHQITSLRNAINQLVYTIKKTGEYVPADLEFILDKMNEISKSEKELLKQFNIDCKKQRQDLVREVRKIVRYNISKKIMLDFF